MEYIGLLIKASRNLLMHLKTFLNELYVKPNFELNVLGDININLLKCRDPNVKQCKNFLLRHGLSNPITDPAHFKTDLAQPRLIDHYLTTDPENTHNKACVPL